MVIGEDIGSRTHVTGISQFSLVPALIHNHSDPHSLLRNFVASRYPRAPQSTVGTLNGSHVKMLHCKPLCVHRAANEDDHDHQLSVSCMSDRCLPEPVVGGGGSVVLFDTVVNLETGQLFLLGPHKKV